MILSAGLLTSSEVELMETLQLDFFSSNQIKLLLLTSSEVELMETAMYTFVQECEVYF